jgi:4-amino-4-deoxy-L-arabinose transferase-like glycosyltransferase
MNSRVRFFALCVLVIGAAMLYGAHLGEVPIYLGNDETEFSLQAHAIATTARDDEGRLLPVYFHTGENSWFHPALVYEMAPILMILPPKPWVVRLPIVLIALIDILLVFVLARRLGVSDIAALGAAALLAVTPAHFMHGRFVADYLCPVPIVLMWLILLIDYDRSKNERRLIAAGTVLGIGLYTYIASVVMMPIYMALTYAVLLVRGERRFRPYALVTVAFVVWLLPAALWLMRYPEIYGGMTHRYGGAHLDVLHDGWSMLAGDALKQRWRIHRSFFEWRYLFDRAESNIMSSTYTTGVFLKAMAVLIPIGLYQMLRNRRTGLSLAIVAVFLSAPTAASLIPEPYATDRALVLLPMAAVIGGFGIDWLVARRASYAEWGARAVLVGLCVWMTIQFRDFYHVYRTGYRDQTAFWFNGNHPEAFEPILTRYPPLTKGEHPRARDPQFVYLNQKLPWIYQHWKLFLIVHGRTDLLSRTVYFDSDFDVERAAPGTLLLTGAGDPIERKFLKQSAVRPIDHIGEPDGSLSFTIFERTHGDYVRSRQELFALARVLATEGGDVPPATRRLFEGVDESDPTREPLALLRAVAEGQRAGSAGETVIRAGGGVVAPADLHGDATLEGFTVHPLPNGDRAVFVYFTPRRAWRGHKLWAHAYPQGSHEYIPLTNVEPDFDGWRPGQLAWEPFRVPANTAYVIYVGVEMNHDLGPATPLGTVR